MTRAVRFRLTVFSIGFVIIGCDRSPPPASDSAQTVSAPVPPNEPGPAGAANPGGPCPRTGQWAVCSLEKRLEQSGFVARKTEGEVSRRLGLSVPPVAYSLGRAKLEIFVYPDKGALSRDVANLDTTIVAPRGRQNDWEIPPRFIRSENLIAVFLTRNEQQAERLALAITAGPPQR